MTCLPIVSSRTINFYDLAIMDVNKTTYFALGNKEYDEHFFNLRKKVCMKMDLILFIFLGPV